MTHRTATRVLFTLAAAGALAAVVLAAIGGFFVRVAGIRLSARGAIRPLLFSLLMASIAMRILSPAERSRLIERSSRLGARLAPWSAAAIAAVVLAVALTYGTRSAGGSDSYGYVSQARLWLRGDLHIHQEFVAAMPWPDAEWTFSPLGYRPAENHTIVPTYAPGLPILMAAAAKIGGACGPFVVTPLCAAVVVLFAYAIGWRLSGPATGIAAALIVATSPTFIYMSLWSMSDVPATAFWTAALVFAWQARGTAVAALAGLSAGAAIAVRPNLAPLVLFPAALLLVAKPETRVRRAFSYALCTAPCVVLIAVFNHTLYGSALQSGYGDTASLFSVKNIGINTSQFSRWLWETQGPLIFVCVVAPIAAWRPSRSLGDQTWRGTAARLVLLAYVGAVFACYLLYTPFQAWWFLRFVLPAFPLVFALAADAVWVGSGRFGLKTRAVAMLVFTLVCMEWGVRTSKQQGVLDLGEGEGKYSDVGRFVARELPPRAVLISIQHSGSVRYYSDRLTLRYDWLASDWLDRAVDYLKSTGSEPYLLLEAFEVSEFRQKFKGQKTVAALDRQPIAIHPRGVYLYAIEPAHVPDALRSIPRTSGCK